MNFTKMHGAGNDFVIFDARREPLALSVVQIRHIADRDKGIGCDQVIVIEGCKGGGTEDGKHSSIHPFIHSSAPAALMRIYNADGSEVENCGNALRCVAWLLMRETGSATAEIALKAGVMRCEAAGEAQVRVDMGAPKFGWKDIPLSEEKDTLHLGIAAGVLSDPAAVSMGNPHAVFFVDDMDAVPLKELGPALERHAIFPERANIGVAHIVSPEHIRLRVWERGAGETLACGTGACAALVAAHRRGLAGRRATVTLPGGDLVIEWTDAGNVLMTGPVEKSFEGEVEL